MFACDDVVDCRSEKSDVGAGTDLGIDIGYSRSARKARIDVYDLSAAHLCFHDPRHRHRMILGGVVAFDQKAARIFEIDVMVRRCASPEACSQTGNSRAMSESRLMLYVACAE